MSDKIENELTPSKTQINLKRKYDALPLLEKGISSTIINLNDKIFK